MKIYFMGICGTAMGNAAILMKRLGHSVCGSDTGIYDPMKSALAKADIDIFPGWNPQNIKLCWPDLIVVGNAISRMNPELEYVLAEQNFKYTSLPALIGENIISQRPSLVVSGTHGKTTTTTLASYILMRNSVNCGWIIGGIPENLEDGGSRLGGSTDNSPFVIEGDEYDSAFFDKRSKFIHYRPRILAINNIEFDHADIFRDLIDVKRAFTHVRRIVSPVGAIVENGDDDNIASLEPTPWTRRIKVGFGKSCDVIIKDFSQNSESSSFSISRGNKQKFVEWKMQGEFNARNAAMAAVSCAALLNRDPLDLDLSCLADFGGVKRRQQILLSGENIIVVEDFAHHPTAIKFTLESLRQRYKEFALVACFEPRSNTAKTNIFQDAFAKSLSIADRAYIGAVNAAKIEESRRFDGKKVAAQNPSKFQAFESNAALLEKLQTDLPGLGKKVLVVFFSNGSFDGIHNKFAESNKARCR